MKHRMYMVTIALAVACGDGSSSAGDETSSSGGADASATSSGSTGTPSEDSTGTTVAGADASTGTTGSTGPDPSTGTTTPDTDSSTTGDPPQPTCASRGCPDDEWCVTWVFVADTDGEDASTSECVPLPRECSGLTGEELATCLQPVCCEQGNGCPTVDENAMALDCVEDPGQSCECP